MDWGRLVTAMVTPFSSDGAIDDARLNKLVNHLLETGTTALVVCGTTGESPTLSHNEKLRLFECTLKAVDGRVPVLAGTGSNDTECSISLSKSAQDLGVDGLLLVAPYYNRPPQDGLYRHFSVIAESVELPIMLYNIPGRTAVNISVDTILRLADVPNIVALKEATADFAHILQIAAMKPDDFYLYSGDDKFTLPMLAVGAYGVVSVASHVVGAEMTAMIDAYLDGRVQEARMWNGRLLPMFNTLFKTPSPSPVKAALELLDIPVGSVRLPLVDAPLDVVDELTAELTRLNKRSLA